MARLPFLLQLQKMHFLFLAGKVENVTTTRYRLLTLCSAIHLRLSFCFSIVSSNGLLTINAHTIVFDIHNAKTPGSGSLQRILLTSDLIKLKYQSALQNTRNISLFWLVLGAMWKSISSASPAGLPNATHWMARRHSLQCAASYTRYILVHLP